MVDALRWNAYLKQRAPRKLPVATLSILLVTGILTGLQFAFPQVLPALMRTPAAVTDHEWWRFITPLFVHADGWKQIAFVFPAVLIVGTLAERTYGSRQVVLPYFVSGFVGEIAGMAWKPYGAGASVTGAGLLGALAFWMLAKNKTPLAMFGAIVILGAAAVLTGVKDIHGPPILAGATLAAVMLRQTSLTKPV
jgi:membrane associated rhomboid family serine protease